MTVLVIGGGGKTGRPLTQLLRDHRIRYRAASRSSGEGPNACRFDWSDNVTWRPALEGVSSAYLVPPPSGGDASALMIAFLKAAIQAGVSRFVLLSASLLPAGGPAAGQVHLWLQENAAEWTVLRPSWFMQNFSEGVHFSSIRDEDAIYTATGSGRVGFIAAEDIASSAFAALTASKPPNADFVLTGAKAISYDEAAKIMSHAAGRLIVHRPLSVEALADRHRAAGMPPMAAQFLAAMDTMIAAGAEDRVTGGVQSLSGVAPRAFELFAAQNAKVWRA